MLKSHPINEFNPNYYTNLMVSIRLTVSITQKLLNRFQCQFCKKMAYLPESVIGLLLLRYPSPFQDGDLFSDDPTPQIRKSL